MRAAGDPIDTVPLADRPEFVSIVAGWHFDEWGRDAASASIELWIDTLRGQLGRGSAPTAWVALRSDEPVGSVKLLPHDMATYPELTPWLSSLFVVPEARGRGIARDLVRHCEAAARELGDRTLYLYTTTAEDLYAGEGWEVVVREPYGPDLVAIMSKDLRPRGRRR